MTYTYWILLEKSLQSTLQSAVDQLAIRYGTPPFEPHLTFLGGFTDDQSLAISKAPEIASLLRGMRMTVGSVEYSTTYFQNVFVRVKPSIQLMEGYMRARAVVGLPGESLFMPHISLLYGNLSMREREQASEFVVSTFCEIKNASFLASKLIVTPFTQDPAGWEHLVEIDL